MSAPIANRITTEDEDEEYALKMSRMGVDDDVRRPPTSAELGAFLGALNRYEAGVADNVYAQFRGLINGDTTAQDLSLEFTGANRIDEIPQPSQAPKVSKTDKKGSTLYRIEHFTWWAYAIEKKQRGAESIRRLITGHPMFSEITNPDYMDELVKYTSSTEEGGYIEGEVTQMKLLSNLVFFTSIFGYGKNRMSHEPGLADRIRECTLKAQRKFNDDAVAAFRVAEILKENHPEDWDEICDYFEGLESADDILSLKSLDFIRGIQRKYQ